MKEISYYKVNDNMMGEMIDVLTEVEFQMLKTGILKWIAAFIEQTPVAHLLYRQQEETILGLEWIHVKEEYRRQGIGTD